MDRDTLKKILDLAVLAPSGDNVQPWRFEMREGRLLVFNIPERDSSLYNFQSLAGYINNGTLLENISIIAPSFGYKATIDFLFEKNELNRIASINFEKTEPYEHSLLNAIKTRHTNRKPYETKPLTEEQLAGLRALVKESAARVFFVTDEQQKKQIGKAASKNEVVLLSNPKLHSFFFNHIHWVPQKGDEVGFSVETLEIPKGGLPMFRTLSSWKVSRILSLLKIPSLLIAPQNAKLYASAGAHGAIVFDDFSPQSCIFSGMLLQRLWLQSTKMGLHFQPLMGIAFLMERVRAKDTELSKKQQDIIKNAYHEIEETFGVTTGVITAAFRIGRGSEPSGKTKRLPPEIKFS